MNLKGYIASISLAIIVSACFTGIESTPKITAGDLRREKVTETESPEQQLASKIRPLSPGEWKPGRRYLVTDSKIGLVFTGADTRLLPQPGDTLIFHALSPAPSVMGQKASLLSFSRISAPSDTIDYKVEITPEEMAARSSFEIPFTIDLSMVQLADSLLRGRRIYTNTSYWYDSELRQTTGRKYVPVTIDRVSAGNTDYPFRVEFTDEKGEKRCMLMSNSRNGASTRNFPSLFSLSDPRLRYPLITDENWTAITNGRVRKEMTREEARLALGSPSDVAYGNDYSFSYERWIYPGGIFLIFEDGILKSFRQ